jgi:hypothetical protein
MQPPEDIEDEEIDWSCPICGQDPCTEDDYDPMEDVDVEL